MKRLFCFFLVGHALSSVCAQPGGRPKLVVGIVVDQMRADYLQRFDARFGNDGFRRLQREGFVFNNAHIPYSPTVTAAGHACLYTGSIPALHGIVGNDWIDVATGKRMYCAGDSSEQTLGSFTNDGRMSPRNMLANTFGDELRLATHFRSRVFAVSLKDRGAVMPGGHTANGVYWYDDTTGNFISSSYYMKALPDWVNAFNAEKKAIKLMSVPWTPLVPGGYPESVADNRAYARTNIRDSSLGFPHLYDTRNGKTYEGLRPSPGGNIIVNEFAMAMMTNERIGKGEQTDMISISFSSTDNVGHRFGPQSPEVEDCYIRLDLEIARLLKFLDAQVGKGNYSLFLSADHGASYSAGWLRDNKLPAGITRGSVFLREANAVLEKKYGVKDLLQNYFEFQLYFNRQKLAAANINLHEAEDVVVAYLQSRDEVLRAFAGSRINDEPLPDRVKKRFVNGWFPQRSGEIQFILKAHWNDGQLAGTDHGSIYTYDTHIPLIFFGKGFRAGRSFDNVEMTDVAPTMSALLGIQMPNAAVGRVLTSAMKAQ